MDRSNADQNQAIKEYVDGLRLEEPVTSEDFRTFARATIGDRGLMVYLAWKALKKHHPEIDAEAVLREACWQFGYIKGERFGDVATPAEWLKNLSSKAGVLAFDQQFLEMNDERAVKMFRYCPHVEAARSAGATPEELALFCREILMAADVGTIAPFEDLEIEFPGNTCAEGGQCMMTVTKKRAHAEQP